MLIYVDLPHLITRHRVSLCAILMYLWQSSLATHSLTSLLTFLKMWKQSTPVFEFKYQLSFASKYLKHLYRWVLVCYRRQAFHLCFQMQGNRPLSMWPLTAYVGCCTDIITLTTNDSILLYNECVLVVQLIFNILKCLKWQNVTTHYHDKYKTTFMLRPEEGAIHTY